MNERRLDAISRRAGHAMLRHVTDGCLDVTERGRTTTFGSPESDLRARVEILDPAAWTILMRGSTGFAQGYIDRLWTTDDPVGVVRVVARSMPPLDRMRKGWHPLLGRGAESRGAGPAEHEGRARASTSRRITTSGTTSSPRSSTSGSCTRARTTNLRT